jgi:hypothetical protein
MPPPSSGLKNKLEAGTMCSLFCAMLWFRPIWNPVHPSPHVSAWKDWRIAEGILLKWYWGVWGKLVSTSQFRLESDKNNGNFTWRYVCIFQCASSTAHQMFIWTNNISKKVVQKNATQFYGQYTYSPISRCSRLVENNRYCMLLRLNIQHSTLVFRIRAQITLQPTVMFLTSVKISEVFYSLW